jgi:carbon storage regulator CsrA
MDSMLVLARHEAEEIIITVPPCKGQRRIAVNVVRINGDKVKLGFSAGDDVEINRAEVQREIEKQAARAAKS